MKSQLCLAVLLTVATTANVVQFKRARAILFKSVTGDYPSGMAGVIDFFQDSGTVRLNGSVSGLAAGLHGFHVHEKGDLSNGCVAAGAHWNPYAKDHGAQNATVRHYGDLGNIETSATGQTIIDNRDSLLTLNGPLTIIGRAVVVHEMVDDLGLGGADTSKTTGNAGARLACGVIAIVDEDPDAWDNSSLSLFSLCPLLISLVFTYMH